MSGITLSDDQLNKVMAQAVLTYLTPEKRDELLTKAVTEFFNAKDKSGYDKRPEIEKAFTEVIAKVGREEAEKLIRGSPETMEKIRRCAHDGIHKVLGSDKLTDHIASGLARSLNIHSL